MDIERIKQGAIGMFGTMLSAAGIGLGEIESIVSIVCSIIGLIITIAGVLVIPVIKKVIAAKKDGKVTPDEVDDIIDTIQDGLEQVGNALPKEKEKDE